MWLSGLAIALLLLVSPAMFAQHSSGGGSSSGGSSGGSSSSGGSHGGSSGGSSSGSSSSSSHSWGSSASSSSHGSRPSSSDSSNARSGGRHEIENGGRARGHDAVQAVRNPQPASRRFFNFLCHPFRKHATEPVEDYTQPKTCPRGQSLDKNGRCVEKSTAASSGLTDNRL
jgi:hypothetical protein